VSLLLGLFDRPADAGCLKAWRLMRVRRVSQLKSCGGDDFAPRLHG
jgi:hypothetical protein